MATARLWGLTLLGLACTAWVGGCGKSPLPLTPVTGKVTYKGFPLQSGSIVFAPDGKKGERGPIAHGKIREDGTYTLYTVDAYGATPGFYQVTILSLAPGSGLPGEPYSIPQSLVPEKYRDPELSLLACEVKPHKSNQIDFNLD